MTHVAIAIPSIAKRANLLKRALGSATRQAVEPGVKITTHVHLDEPRTGAWGARNAALRLALDANPNWIAFLDDDDELLPNFVQHNLDIARENDADFVYGWYEVIGGGDPFAVEKRTAPMDIDDPHIIPISYMVHARHARHALDTMGGFQPENGENWLDQDWPIIKAMMLNGATMFGSGVKTWKWHHHGLNTSGLKTQNA